MSSTALTQRRSAIPIRRSSIAQSIRADSTAISPPPHTVRGHQALATFRDMQGAGVSGGTFLNTTSSVYMTVNNEGHGGRSMRPLENQGIVDSIHDYSPPIPTPGPSQKAEHDIYYQHLLGKGRGTPLWEPGPELMLPTEYRRNGVSIGDVGIVYRAGDFAFLFNIFLPADHEINRGRVPNGFIPLDKSKMTIKKKNPVFNKGSCLGSSVRHMPPSDFAFQTTGREGAVLVMPDGALSEDLRSCKLVEKYVTDNAKIWYNYVNGDDCGIETENGDLRVVIGMDKASSWGMAAFESVNVEDPLRFELRDDQRAPQTRTYKWEGIMAGKAGPEEEEIRDLLQGPNSPPLCNQCVFVRTLNLSVSGKLHAVSAVHEIRASPVRFKDCSPDLQAQSGIRNGNIQTSPIGQPVSHPSKLLNKHLLEKCPKAEVVITKDSDWMSVITESDTTTPSFEEICARVLASHLICEKEGVVTLKKRKKMDIPDPIAIPIEDQQTISEDMVPTGNENGSYVIGRLFLQTPDDESLTEPLGTPGNSLMEPRIREAESPTSLFDRRNPSSRDEGGGDVFFPEKPIVDRNEASGSAKHPAVIELEIALEKACALALKRYTQLCSLLRSRNGYLQDRSEDPDNRSLCVGDMQDISLQCNDSENHSSLFFDFEQHRESSVESHAPLSDSEVDDRDDDDVCVFQKNCLEGNRRELFNNEHESKLITNNGNVVYNRIDPPGYNRCEEDIHVVQTASGVVGEGIRDALLDYQISQQRAIMGCPGPLPQPRTRTPGLRFNVAHIPSSSILDLDSPLSFVVKQNIFLNYSCRNWDNHLSAGASGDLAASSLSEFLELRSPETVLKKIEKSIRPVFWPSAPAGSGKSAIVRTAQRQTSAGETVLNELKSWIEDDKNEPTIFWLSAPAGTGKLTIAQTFQSQLESLLVLASAFFNRSCSSGSRNKNKPTFWLSAPAGTGKSTIAQTFQSQTPTQEIVLNKIEKSNNAVFRLNAPPWAPICSRDFEDRRELHFISPTHAINFPYKILDFQARLAALQQMDRLIVEPLHSAQVSTLIVIDALDEPLDNFPWEALKADCLSRLASFGKRGDMIRFLRDVNARGRTPNFITGRPELIKTEFLFEHANFNLDDAHPSWRIHHIAFTPDGVRLASGPLEEVVRCWVARSLVATGSQARSQTIDDLHSGNRSRQDISEHELVLMTDFKPLTVDGEFQQMSRLSPVCPPCLGFGASSAATNAFTSCGGSRSTEA